MMSDGVNTWPRIWFVGFAGHRAVPDPITAKAAIRRELELIQRTVKGELVGLASAAAGADLLFLESCRELGLRTVVILPFAKERFALDFEDPKEWERALHELEQAWWWEVSPGAEEAPAAYHVVAREVLEVADRMLFLWNGKPARGLGGTAESVEEAQLRGIASRIIDDATLQANWNGTEPQWEASDPGFQDLPPAASVAELFQLLDERASRNAPKSRRFNASSLSLNHLAGVVQAVFVTFAALASEAGALLKLILVTIASWLPWIGGRLRWQAQWSSDRVRAELLRSLMYSHDPGSPLRPPAIELFGKEEAFLRTAAMRLVDERHGWQAARDTYLKDRIDDQIAYLSQRGELAKRRMSVLGKLFTVTSWAAMASGAAVVLAAFHKKPLPLVVAFLAAVLPGISAWLLAMISVYELKRRANLYHRLVEELQRQRPKLEAAKCASAVAQVMHQVERLLLNELWEWQGSLKK